MDKQDIIAIAEGLSLIEKGVEKIYGGKNPGAEN